MTTGERIKHLRNQHGLLQSDLARRVGCSKQRISNIERGVTQLPADLAAKIADVFGITVEEITYGCMPDTCRLSPEEQALLQIYRSLDQNDRLVLLKMYEMFLNSR